MTTPTNQSNDAPPTPQGIGPVGCASLLVGAFLLAWNAIALVFLALTIRGLVHQHDAASFTPTQATITRADAVTSHTPNGGSSVHLDIEFTYTAEGTQHTATTYSLAATRGMWLDREKRQFAEAHPPGTAVTAFVDPDNPDRAVLSRDIAAADHFLLLVLAAFNAAGIALFLAAADGLRVAFLKPPFAGKPVRREGEGRFRIRLVRVPPLIVGVAALAAAAGLATIAVGIAILTTGVTTTTIAAALLLAAVAGLMAWAHARFSATSRRRDIIIDRTRQSITLPPRAKQDNPEIIDLERAVRISINSPNPRSDATGPTAVNIDMAQQPTPQQRRRVIEWHDQRRADLFARDLADFTGLPLHAKPASSDPARPA